MRSSVISNVSSPFVRNPLRFNFSRLRSSHLSSRIHTEPEKNPPKERGEGFSPCQICRSPLALIFDLSWLRFSIVPLKRGVKELPETYRSE
jgi:hypothetical protein